ncbi:Zinc carboxypeptidase [Amphritea atlantica]|uniref:Zinc carboxypeptidase n=1 Tax=Amphritea atlantica TaxID=355243 RepID=A0A1H9JF18_9GAMM|nr:M14 family zinc carboxypeptidase [Amphritea atlantica]SEQ85383.1 Zinc carboxypeptidase [Amphritea atlantica]
MFLRLITIIVAGLTLSIASYSVAEPEDPLSLYINTQPRQADHTVNNPTDSKVLPETKDSGAATTADSDTTDVRDKVSTAASKTPATNSPETHNSVSKSSESKSAESKNSQTEIADTHSADANRSQSRSEAKGSLSGKVTKPAPQTGPYEDVISICQQIGAKLGSVSTADCLAAKFDPPRFYSNRHLPLLEKHFPADPDTEKAPRILFLGGIHGDEYSSVSISFKWLKILQENHSGIFDWHYMPLTNPDGLLQKKSTRVNANNVDLNRNFIPAETAIDPLKHWQTYAKKRARYYPGTTPLSEPETQAIHQLIDELQPDIIVSVHAPHGILDYDGTITPPRRLGPLHLRQLGTYPGSLGNYGWFVKHIPVMTIELKHAGIMPSQHDIDRMWSDLIQWIKQRTEGDGTLLARKEAPQSGSDNGLQVRQ